MHISNGRSASDKAARAASSTVRPSADPGSPKGPRAAGPGPVEHAIDAVASTGSERPWHRLDPDRLAAGFDKLVEKTIAAAGVPANADQLDLTFGPLGAVASFIHSARCHDGLMLQAGLAMIAAEHPDLTVLTRDVELPVTEAAQALIARNRPAELSGIRLGSEVFAREHYKADFVLVDEARRFAVLCDVKRSIASYNAAKLGRLKAKLLACAVVAPDHLRTRHQIDGIRICHAAILDLSGHAELADDDVFGIDQLDAFLRIEGAGAAMHNLKRRFGDAVQAALVGKLQAIDPALRPIRGRASGPTRSGMAGRSLVVDDDDAADEDDAVDDALPAAAAAALMPTVSVALARPAAGSA